MGGINDIKKAFSTMAPGIDLRAVRMNYDHADGKQILEFDIVENGVTRTVVEKLDMGAGMRVLLEAAMKVAQSLGAEVTVTPEVPPVPTSEMAKAAGLSGIHKLVNPKWAEPGVEVGEPEPIGGAVKTIEHDGQTYELAVDGKPKSLFF